MDTLHVSHGHSKGSSRSQSPSTADLARDPAVVTDDAVIRSRVQSPSTVHHVVSEPSSRHGEPRSHHVKSHSRDLGNSPLSANTTGNCSRDLEDSPQKKNVSNIMGGDYACSVYSPNVSYSLSTDEYGSPAYRSQDGDYSLNIDDSDGGSNVTSAKAQAAIAHLNSKIERTKDLIRLEQTIRDDNVNEYLKLAANADKQQLQRIKAVFEKKNQKSALCIVQLQKKLEGYNKRIKSWEQHGTSGQAHRQPREVLRDMGQGLKNVGGNIRDGITGLGGSVMAAPREFAHLFSRSNRFGSADNIAQLAAPQHAELRANASSEGSRASEAGEGAQRGSTLPRAATSPAPKFSPDASPSSSVTSEGAPYPPQTGSNNMTEAAFTLKPILNELRERREDYERLAEKIDALKNLAQDVSFLSSALQEERFKTERLEEQINDLTELHQNEVENLKQALTDVEEKVQYQSEERIRDIHEALDLCQTKISKVEQWMAGGAGGAGAGGGAGEAHAAALPPRLLLVKLLNVALTLLQLALLLVATVAGVAMPFLRTRYPTPRTHTQAHAAALPPRLLLVKLLNVALTLLQLALLLVATVAGVAMPFLRTRYPTPRTHTQAHAAALPPRLLLVKLLNVALTLLQLALLLVATVAGVAMPFLRTRYPTPRTHTQAHAAALPPRLLLVKLLNVALTLLQLALLLVATVAGVAMPFLRTRYPTPRTHTQAHAAALPPRLLLVKLLNVALTLLQLALLLVATVAGVAMPFLRTRYPTPRTHTQAHAAALPPRLLLVKLLNVALTLLQLALLLVATVAGVAMPFLRTRYPTPRTHTQAHAAALPPRLLLVKLLNVALTLLQLALLLVATVAGVAMPFLRTRYPTPRTHTQAHAAALPPRLLLVKLLNVALTLLQLALLLVATVAGVAMPFLRTRYPTPRTHTQAHAAALPPRLLLVKLLNVALTLLQLALLLVATVAGVAMPFLRTRYPTPRTHTQAHAAALPPRLLLVKLLNVALTLLQLALLLVATVAGVAMPFLRTRYPTPRTHTQAHAAALPPRLLLVKLLNVALTLLQLALLLVATVAGVAMPFLRTRYPTPRTHTQAHAAALPPRLLLVKLLNVALTLLQLALLLVATVAGVAMPFLRTRYPTPRTHTQAHAAALPPRLLLVKLLNVALTLLQLALLLVATVAGVAMPFLRTRVRVLTTSLAVMVGVMVLKQWPEVLQLSEHLLRRLKEYLLDAQRDRYECKSLCG
ncbi:uncharacterized protein [Epargyreus clarus]|uniref:uncharacterized protein isoform X2 n=1 Tax=Epargyreus clarus TaxID=520877 RepID=UPI003C2AF93D